MPGVVTIGESMGLFVATAAGQRPDTFRLGMGGAESNVAIGLARLGGEATWMGRLGVDSAGELIQRELRAEGVRTRIVLDPGAPTGLMIKSQPLSGVTRVEYHRRASAGSRLSPDDVDADTIRQASVLHITGITPALSPSAADAITVAMDVADGAGIPISFDMNHRPTLWRGRDAAEVYRSIAARSTIVFAGLDEAALIVAGATPDELARGIAELGPTQVLVKLGGDGCFALVNGEPLAVAAIPITPADTVGAGDAFAAGYLAELLEGENVASRLATAVRAGAFACLGPGDWESLPRRSDLDLLGGNDPVIR